MKYTLLYIAILTSFPLQGQNSFSNDTIKINEVIISSRKTGSYSSGYKEITIDSLTLKNYSHASLADVLSENSKIFIKSYGAGGSATPSFRGTGANQTQIAWNGININHPMLGQCDLSLIPSGLIDEIQIYFGGASMILNSGGIGGIINLETKPVWKEETQISLNPGLGSFGHYAGLVKVRSGGLHFQSVTKAFLQSAENDFKFLNSSIGAEPVWQTRSNSQVSQRGLVQELYYRRTKNITSFKIWYQSTNRNLPASILVQQTNSGEKQFDESVRTMLNFDIFRGRSDFFLTGSWMLNRLNYSNNLVSIDSRNLTGTYIFKAGMENRLNENTKLKIVLNEELSVVNSNNYVQSTNRNTISLTALAERKSSNRIGAMVLIREIFDNNTFLIPDFSAGLQFRIIDEKDYFLKTNISRNSRVPTMNDLFWLPGGNPRLRNEYAYIYEISYEMNQKISAPVNLEYEISFFQNTIKDMIQWYPGEYSYWTADNIQHVNSLGLESSFLLDYKLNNLICSLNAGYSLTKSTAGSSYYKNDNLIGKQLIYVPEHQLNASLSLVFRNLYSSWITNLTGKRYITVDNSKYLPAYMLNNIKSGIKLNLKESSFDINFNIDNLFNVNYQTIAYYPLPGRSYSVKILVQITK